MLCVQAAPPPPSLRFLLRPARAHYTAVDVKYCKGLLVLLLLGIRDREKFRRRCAVELEARVPHRLVKRRHQLLELLVVDPARVVGVVAREHLRRVGARRLHPQCRQRRVQLTGVNVATVVGVERLEDRPNGSVVAAPPTLTLSRIPGLGLAASSYCRRLALCTPAVCPAAFVLVCSRRRRAGVRVFSGDVSGGGWGGRSGGSGRVSSRRLLCVLLAVDLLHRKPGALLPFLACGPCKGHALRLVLPRSLARLKLALAGGQLGERLLRLGSDCRGGLDAL